MIVELDAAKKEMEKELSGLKIDYQGIISNTKDKDIISKISDRIVELTGLIESSENKLIVLNSYKDLTVTVRKYSARQKDLMEQALTNPSVNIKSRNAEPKASIDLVAMKKKAVQFGVIGLDPRIVGMTKIQEAKNGEPEVWQITEETLDGDFDWDLRDLLLEMIQEVNPKNWM